MFSKLSLKQKGRYFIAFTLFLQMSFVIVLVLTQRSAFEKIEQAVHTQQIIGHMNKVSNLWSSLAVESVHSLSNPNYLESPAIQYIHELHSEYKTLDQLLPSGQDKLEMVALENDTNAGLDLLGKASEAWLTKDRKRYLGLMTEVGEALKLCTERSNRLLDRYMVTERKNYQDELNEFKGSSAMVFLGLSINVAATLGFAFFFTSTVARRLELIKVNSVRLANSIPLLPVLPGGDEISMLDHDFHSMADALQEAARKERAVIDQARDLICTLDADGVFLMVNPASEAILGYMQEDMLNHVFLQFVSQDDQDRVKAILENLTAGQLLDPFECTLLTKAGNHVDLLLSAHWSPQDSSLFCVMHDVTQSRQMQRMKQQFVAMITHDLRSPLTAIGGTLHLLNLGVYESASDSGKERIREAEKNIDTMLKLISDLLEMEKFDAARMSLDLKTVSLKSIIEDAVGSIRASFETQNISLEIKSIDVLVEADRFRLVQVLVNLLSNAVKFSPVGSSVSIDCQTEGLSVRVEIKDMGPGISKEDQEIIFEPYKQAQGSSAQDRHKGTGLGLAICKSIVEAHQGTIGVISNGSGGSTFFIQLPLAKHAFSVSR